MPPPAATTAVPIKVSKSSKNQAKEQLPKLPLTVALNWRSVKKDNEKWSNRFRKRLVPSLPGEDLLYRVGMRDHVKALTLRLKIIRTMLIAYKVFIIDDAISMREHWDEMCELFGILAYIVKSSDKDGIDMYFTMSDKKHNDKDTTRLVEIVEKRKNMLRGPSNINVRLHHILGDYDRNLKNEIAMLRGRSVDAPQKFLKPLSVYVFTNAVWTRKSDPKLAIENIVNSLVALNSPASRAGIQFISFGDDPSCLDRLEHYDKGLGLKLYAPCSLNVLLRFVC
jgi:hypothetical protein